MANSFHCTAADDRKLHLLPLLLLVTTFLAGCSTFQPDQSRLLDAQIERQYQELEILSEKSPESVRSLEELEQLVDHYLVQGDVNRAYVYCLKALEKEPGKRSLLQKQAGLLLKKKKETAARLVYGKLLEQDDGDALALEGMGKIAYRLGQMSEAEGFLLRALALRDDLWQAHVYMGLVDCQVGRLDKGRERFEKALLLQPGDESIINNLAVTSYLAGDFQQAIELLGRIRQPSESAKINNNLALAYAGIGEYRLALEAFKAAGASEAVANYNIGKAYYRAQDYALAAEAFAKAIEVSPRYYPAAQEGKTLAVRQLQNLPGRKSAQLD